MQEETPPTPPVHMDSTPDAQPAAERASKGAMNTSGTPSFRAGEMEKSASVAEDAGKDNPEAPRLSPGDPFAVGEEASPVSPASDASCEHNTAPSFDNWEGTDLPDISFAIFVLTRKTKAFSQYRDLVVYCFFLLIFTLSILIGHHSDHSYLLAQGVGGVAGSGEWDQAGSTGLYFQKTFEDIGQTDDWYSWMKSSQTMLSVIAQPQGTYQQQNTITPSIIVVNQRRVAEQDRTSHCAAADYIIGGDWGDLVGCYPAFDEKWQDTSDRTWNGSEYHTHPCHSPCHQSCDVTGMGGFLWSESTLGAFACHVPPMARKMVDWQGRFGTYPPGGYMFDIDPLMTAANYSAAIDCLRANNWLDKQTRQVDVVWFTYNPAIDLFLHNQLSTEFSVDGFVYNAARFTTFRWSNISSPTTTNKVWIALETITFIFVAYYLLRLIYDVVMDICQKKRVCLWVFSVWRIIEICNICFFAVVFIWKFTYWQIDYIPFSSPETCADLGCASSICELPQFAHTRPDHDDGGKGPPSGGQYEFFYAAQLHKVLNGFVYHLQETKRLTAVNALLSWLKLFKFVSLNWRFNLLSETIKASANALLFLVMYVFLITIAFALQGILVFSAYSEGFSTFEKAIFYLFRWLLGDFDYTELLDATMHKHTAGLFIFFWGYQFLCWLVLMNMVISIVSAGFEQAKEAQKKAVGNTTLGPLLRRSVDETEMYCRTCIGSRRYPKSPFTLRPDGFRICGVPLPMVIYCLSKIESKIYGKAERERWCGTRDSQDRRNVRHAEYDLRKHTHPRRASHGSDLTGVERMKQQLLSGGAVSGACICGVWTLCGEKLDEERAEQVARAVCWYFAEDEKTRVNRKRQFLYESRVYWDEVVKEEKEQAAELYKQEFLKEVDNERERKSSIAPSLPLSPAQSGDVGDTLRELRKELQLIREERTALQSEREALALHRQGLQPPPNSGPASTHLNQATGKWH